ncbi:aminodeoxychorismate lyase [Kangiella sediminilitoris]|uniref:Aminodeoxychorismate lyase n=1 Tax=Kangiella sediminilitoris TaxID=1144748 RepID=A0A1B3BAI0_9GAMM|nr:aminodeoxychorismate lyase [Kangiella sediminilitoris]AOE49810.1 Aminodeoxychorismate lyase [Kangiella sediminilitoris]
MNSANSDANTMATNLLNGAPSEHIAIDDRGLLYGDGFFTTIRVRENQIEHWPLHAERIQLSAEKLKFPELNIPRIEKELRSFINNQYEDSGVVRLTITRGCGPRGYRAPSEPKFSIIASWSSFVSSGELQNGVELSICETPYSKNSALAGLKHLNRLEQVLAQEEIPESCFDGIMLADDLIVGGSKTNIYFYREGLWLTPSMEVAGVNGTVRRWLLANRRDVQVSVFGLEILSLASHCMVTNALHGVVPVTKIGQHKYDVWPQTAELNRAYCQDSI